MEVQVHQVVTCEPGLQSAAGEPEEIGHQEKGWPESGRKRAHCALLSPTPNAIQLTNICAQWAGLCLARTEKVLAQYRNRSFAVAAL
jgi:hypothetical protein